MDGQKVATNITTWGSKIIYESILLQQSTKIILFLSLSVVKLATIHTLIQFQMGYEHCN